MDRASIEPVGTRSQPPPTTPHPSHVPYVHPIASGGARASGNTPLPMVGSALAEGHRMYLAPTVLASPLATPTPSSPPPTASFLRGYYKQNCVRSKQLGPGCGAGLGAGAGARRCYFVLVYSLWCACMSQVPPGPSRLN